MPTEMKTVVHFADGSIEQTTHADILIAHRKARLATTAEIRGYERNFERDDASWERMAMEGDSGPSQPSYEY